MPNIEEVFYTLCPSFEEEDLVLIRNRGSSIFRHLQDIDIYVINNREFIRIYNLLQSLQQVANSMGLWAARRFCRLAAKDIEDIVATGSCHGLFSTGSLCMRTEFERCDACYSQRLETFGCVYDQLIRGASPKMRVLLEKLHEHVEDLVLKGIIFVQDKTEAELISCWLKELAEVNQEHFGFLRVEYLAQDPNQVHQFSRREEILAEFQNQQLNILVTTSIVGVQNFSSCTLVILYDPFPSLIESLIFINEIAFANSKYILLSSDVVEVTSDDVGIDKENLS